MAVPFSNWSALCTLPELCLRSKPPFTEAELRRSFLTVANPLHTAFACIQLLSANEVRFCCTSTRKLEDVMNTGLNFRGHPLTVGPIHTKKWVTIWRVAYATPHNFVRQALAPYDEVDSIRPEIIDKVATGTLFGQVDITKDIPSKLRIRGHNCIIWYRDQPRTFFLCGQYGHERRHCPQRQGRHNMVPQQFSQEPGTHHAGIRPLHGSARHSCPWSHHIMALLSYAILPQLWLRPPECAAAHLIPGYSGSITCDGNSPGVFHLHSQPLFPPSGVYTSSIPAGEGPRKARCRANRTPHVLRSRI